MPGPHLDYMKQMMDPEVFEEYERKWGPEGFDLLEIREEVATKIKDINPPGLMHMVPESLIHNSPWLLTWARERGGLNTKDMWRVEYEEFIEWTYRILHATEIAAWGIREKPDPDELIKAKWLCHMSNPPCWQVRADLGYATTQLLYGKYATTEWIHPNFWIDEVIWIQGYHIESGAPVQHWIMAMHEEMAKHCDEEDEEILLTPSDRMATPGRKHLPDLLDRRHLRSGIKMRDIPKKYPYELNEWLKPLRDLCVDVREELFPGWGHATLYSSISPGTASLGSQHVFWGTAHWWTSGGFALNSFNMVGAPFLYYGYEPFPPYLNTLLALPREIWVRRMGELFLSGPKGMLCEAINKKATSPKKTYLLHEQRELIFDKGKIFKDIAIPYDEGIPPPQAFLTTIYGLMLKKDANIQDFVSKPELLPKEYWDLLESEGGIDKKTGHIPRYDEVPRLKWLWDPTLEWFKPKDFLPFDYRIGQVWPFDITREKMEIMIEEGYDGTGEDILHYSWLADKKMGRKEGEIITLGTLPYKIPICKCSRPH